MHQRVIAGLGNIYSDEVLFRAGIRWNRPCNTLTGDEIEQLFVATDAILREAIELGGSSLGDGQYVDVYGTPGRFQERHAVYARAGRECVRCGDTIRRERWGGRSTFWCARCQQ